MAEESAQSAENAPERKEEVRSSADGPGRTDNRSENRGDSRGYRDRRNGPDDRENRPFRGGRKPFFKKKVCRFCTQDVVADYKNPDLLRRFITDRGKILPRRITGTCAKHQRALSREIKRARVLAYIPFVKK